MFSKIVLFICATFVIGSVWLLGAMWLLQALFALEVQGAKLGLLAAVCFGGAIYPSWRLFVVREVIPVRR